MFDIKEELKKLPSTPGVYIMKSENDEIIYIGKAINLKNRVKQYFTGTKSRGAKTIALVSHIKEFEYIITDSEMEALILECNLIKKHKPKYNIMLKDDKKYPYIKVTVNEVFPVIYKTRRRLDDGALYIGPITDATAVNETID
ncbi:MAG: GIY-YIG nuclease family protein, partial [Firmicutes bacterium]|nr:GIY-YIG nuclease family protein [Bacillota bacterium]